jgi:hypothetical protein
VAFGGAYGHALLLCAALLAGGGIISWLTIVNPAQVPPSPEEPERRATPQLDCPSRGR